MKLVSFRMVSITETGQPVEFFLTPGAYSDTATLRLYNFDLPEGSKTTGDKAYNDYETEDLLAEANLPLTPLRKKNSKRPLPPWVHYLMSSYKKLIETTGSLIEQLFPKHIHAVTARGFELKVALFVLACSVNYAYRPGMTLDHWRIFIDTALKPQLLAAPWRAKPPGITPGTFIEPRSIRLKKSGGETRLIAFF